jgi:hypothetical protein
MYTITRREGGFEFGVAVPADERFGDVAITGISMYVAEDEDDGCGDLAVTWTVEGADNADLVMEEFYWDGGYNLRLQELLAAAGVPVDIAAEVGTSEWGMQDEGRASYDAYALADWVREQAMATA